MQRRELIFFLGGSAAAWPLVALGQSAPARIGFLASGADGSVNSVAQIEAIKQGLREQGLIEGRDFVFEARFAAGNYEKFPEMARGLAHAGTRVILVNTIASVRAAQRLVPPMPVVMVAINDPVGAGLVQSLARPGNYTTGMATLNEDLTLKLLEYQRTIIPKASTIAVLFNPANPTNPVFLEKLKIHAGSMGITVLPIELHSPDALNAAFAAIAAQHPDAVQILADSAMFDLVDRIADFALSHRLPSFATGPDFVEFGGLMAYGAPRLQLLTKSAYFVKRILDGANPGELPVEQPTRIELWINLKTAKAIGLEIPANLQQLADRVVD